MRVPHHHFCCCGVLGAEGSVFCQTFFSFSFFNRQYFSPSIALINKPTVGQEEMQQRQLSNDGVFLSNKTIFFLKMRKKNTKPYI